MDVTCFAPNRVCVHRAVRTPVLIINFLFRARLDLQWIKEREINMLCVIMFHYANVLSFLLGKRERYFKHLIAS